MHVHARSIRYYNSLSSHHNAEHMRTQPATFASTLTVSESTPHVKVHCGDAANSLTLVCLGLIISAPEAPSAVAVGLAAAVGGGGFCGVSASG